MVLIGWDVAPHTQPLPRRLWSEIKCLDFAGKPNKGLSGDVNTLWSFVRLHLKPGNLRRAEEECLGGWQLGNRTVCACARACVCNPCVLLSSQWGEQLRICCRTSSVRRLPRAVLPIGRSRRWTLAPNVKNASGDLCLRPAKPPAT